MHAFLDVPSHSFIRVELRFLGQITDFDIGLWARFTEDISVYSSHDFQQSGLARPVQAEDTYFGAWKKRQRYVFQNLFFWGDNFSHAVHGVNVLRQDMSPLKDGCKDGECIHPQGL